MAAAQALLNARKPVQEAHQHVQTKDAATQAAGEEALDLHLRARKVKAVLHEDRSRGKQAQAAPLHQADARAGRSEAAKIIAATIAVAAQ